MILNKENKYVIFGTGMSSYSYSRSFKRYPVLFYLDNAKERQNTLYNDRPVLSPAVLKQLDFTDFKTIVASEFYSEISKQLKEFGLEEGKDFFNEKEVFLEETDLFLISFMKCGRTWLRYLIGQLIENKFQLDNEDKLIYTDCIQINDKLPKIKAYHDDNPHNKKHDELTQSLLEFKKHKVIFLVRDPRDVAVSLFYHMKYRSKHYNGNIDDFVLGITPTIVKYYNIWYNNRSEVGDILFVKYENLHNKSVETLKEVGDFIGIEDLSQEILTQAIANSSFQSMKKYENSNKSDNAQLQSRRDENASKVRKGKIGGYEDELNPTIVNELNDFIDNNLNKFYGYK